MDCNHHGYPQWRGLLPIIGSEIMVWPYRQVTTPTASSLATSTLATIDSSFGPSYATCVCLFDLVFSGRLLSIFLSLSWCLHCFSLWAVWLLSKGGNAHCFSIYDYLLFLSLFSTHTFRSYISHVWLWWWYEWGGVSELDRDSDVCEYSSLKSIMQTLDFI